QSAHLRYEDQSLPMILAFDRFDHSGKGDFASMQFDLVTLTEVEGFSLIYDGITYFNGASIQLGATMEMDLDELRYTLKENKLNLNELELSGEGFIDLNDDDIELDLSFSTSKSDFRQLVSVLPGAYIDDFNQVQIEGTFEAESQISGIYSDDQLPAFNFSAVIEDGSIKYPDLPLGMNKINLDLSVEKPAGVMDLVSVALEQIQLEIGQQPLSGHLLIRTPVSDPDVTGRIVGRLDLANLTQAYPLQDVETLSGIIDSDVRFRASQSQLDKKDYKNIEVNGSLDLVDLIYVASGNPEINIIKSGLTFSPQAIQLSETQVTAGQSDIRISGKIENILSLLSPEKTLVGSLNLRSERLDLDEWYQTDATLDTASATTTPNDAFATPDKAIPAYDFDFDLQIKELVFNGESITELKARSRLRPEQINIVEMSAGMRGSDIRLEGTLNNLTGYLAGESKVTGDVTLTSRRLNLNAFMSEETGSNNVDTAVLSPFIVPDNIDVGIDAKISELIYTDMIFKDLSGQVMIRDQTANLKDCSAEAFGGKLQLAGGYRTTKGEKPHFDLKYDMRNVQFSQVAQQLSYLGALAPIIKYLDGRFSTSFISNGVLQDDFMPDLSTLNLDGLVETSECILKSFGPAEELGRKLKMNFLQSPKIKNTKNWVEVRNGMVEIKEFDYLLEDVAMQISGTQSLTQELNYLIKMKVPRKYLDAKELTKEFNTQFSWLTEEANKLGFRLSNGEFINVNVILTGTLSKPLFNLKLVGMDGEKP
ncbi:MAG: hypothetical protein HKN76_07015, partial [Saprospiraceae bacterium]|nr:hypothetical protein [Saprospiraceae bacterium]